MNTSTQEYFHISNDMCQSWDSNYSDPLTSWTSNQIHDIPIWHYASDDLSYFSSPSTPPIIPYSIPSISHNTLAPPPNPLYPPRSTPSSHPSPYISSADEDSDRYSWGPSTPATELNSSGRLTPHKRIKSESKPRAKDAKQAHTVVERNYRDRLNEQIASLGLHLFETPPNSRSRPSKSLIITRAKERLQQLESRNKSLEGEVTKLRQQIAVLKHVGGKQIC